MRTLSERTIKLLRLVDSRTAWAGTERPGIVLTAYYVPMPLDFVSGSGDAARLRALARYRLIKQTSHMREIHSYAYKITEDGIAELARHEKNDE